ncbi:hypothetical protein [Cellulophaga omnivescoria]|uniref:hypothetical protein n=1 Tax=Cellulophaga omnivescoria TaxID=1888890 RepID=UPI0011159A82|nr:hypothetical protein [Cellulophaga omnivescoria]WBU88745.1 hypothetical protein PBN93_12810 [Cellulophaga omnivescoria]WKB80720.1 hypothetical protein QYR09_13300 [Cellulophaga lytica]
MKNKTRNIVTILFFLIGTTFFYGQNNDWEKIKSLKVAFFTEQLELSSDEAKGFWPVYDDFEKELHKLYDDRRELKKKYNYNNLSEKDSKHLLETYLEFEKQKVEITKKHYAKISKVLSYRKTYKLARLEEDFKRRLIREYRNKHKKGKQ